MIEVIAAGQAAAALAGINAEMAGMTLSQAWDAQGFEDPVEAGYGVDFGVNVTIIGANKGSISGDTSETISTNLNADPVDAWHDYVENEPLVSVSEETGGAVSGSSVYTTAYSLLETHPEPGMDVIKAVVPVAIPVQDAYVAISQALGVSMDAAEMDVETKRAFAESIVSVSGLVYDKARNLVKAWWDGVNILFPRETVEAVEDAIEELNIPVQPSGGYTSDLDTGLFTQPITTITTFAYYMSAGGTLYKYVRTYNRPILAWTAGDNWRVFCPADHASDQITYVQDQYYADTGVLKNTTTNTSNVGYYRTYNGKSVYGTRGSGTGASEGILYQNISPTDESKYKAGWTVLYGTYIPTGEYPEGTEASEATKYTAAGMASAGAIAVYPNQTKDVVPIMLPADPTNTIGSTADPAGPTNPDDVNSKPAPPIPLPIPDTNVSNPDVPLVDSSVVNSTLINELVEELANTLDPQPSQSSGLIPVPLLPGIPDGQGGSSYPSIVPASGSGLIHVYNPTPGEFVSFGNWLWVTYADATIDKIWNNPFDGIIGAFELYASPQLDGSDNIRSGFLVCPTTAALVRQRYTEIDCGTIIVPEFYGNYLDYSPYSQAYIYLPFIGINEVSIDDIVGHAINIRYRVDAYNGSCIAMIYVAKDGYRNLCYQFAGNCAVEVPLAGGSQAAIKAGVMQAEAYSRAGIANAALSGASAIGSGLAMGGAAGGLMGGLSMLGGMAGAWYSGQRSIDAARVANKSTVQHSGQFGASHGAMGLKVPHIMIRNPIQVKVVNYNDDYGFPAHKRVIIGGCTGYLRVREVNVISAHATDEEKMAIEAALKNGVYVS